MNNLHRFRIYHNFTQMREKFLTFFLLILSIPPQFGELPQDSGSFIGSLSEIFSTALTIALKSHFFYTVPWKLESYVRKSIRCSKCLSFMLDIFHITQNASHILGGRKRVSFFYYIHITRIELLNI